MQGGARGSWRYGRFDPGGPAWEDTPTPPRRVKASPGHTGGSGPGGRGQTWPQHTSPPGPRLELERIYINDQSDSGQRAIRGVLPVRP